MTVLYVPLNKLLLPNYTTSRPSKAAYTGINADNLCC